MSQDISLFEDQSADKFLDLTLTDRVGTAKPATVRIANNLHGLATAMICYAKCRDIPMHRVGFTLPEKDNGNG